MKKPATVQELERQIRIDNAKLVLMWVLGIAALVMAYEGYEAVTTPTSWADCVLSKVGGVQNDVAAAAVANSCTQRFGSYENRVPLPWYRFAHGRYADGNECVVHEAANVVDTARIMNGTMYPGIRVSLIAAACHALYDKPTQ
ncbi:hypothetical protein [Paraburkholderia dipogonis]|uniref:hypothetical protein n=1 Tax=Paraburkholderia dipogonis TaxID=1211383 RepID=UPI0038B98C82